MKLKQILPVIFFVLLSLAGMTQTGVITGTVADANTKETLIGATVAIQGTSNGAITDFDGNFRIEKVTHGSYNLVISYISYDNQIVRVEVKDGQESAINVALKPASVDIEEVKVVAHKRTNTEMSMLSSLKSSDLVVSGISAQQISRSQDKDAAEIIRRVPGVSIRDDKFVIVRGLTERYNTVWLNNASTPSSEADVRSFSFDAIPSGLIDNILIYKTAAPELPADFAGAAINILTKTLVDKNGFSISIGTGGVQGTVFNDFYRYKGSSTDWLGFDNGTRALPSGFPTTTDFRRMADNSTEADKAEITRLGQGFSSIWTPDKMKAKPDMTFSFESQKRFNLGKMSLSNITAINYSNKFKREDIFRAAYQAYDTTRDVPNPSYHFNDERFTNTTRLSGLMNWMLIFGNNQKIEFRNLFNQMGTTRTTLRDGENNYGGNFERSYELAYESRMIYSSQLGGDFSFLEGRDKLDFTLGYSFANKLQPDIRRVKSSLPDGSPEGTPYSLGINFAADPTFLGRLFLENHEHIWMAGANNTFKFSILGINPEVKTGIYLEKKDRTFVARNVGYAISNITKFDWNLSKLPYSETPFDQGYFDAIQNVFARDNINETTGLKIDESTDLKDSYSASNRLAAGYIGLKFPILKALNLNGGLRIEKNDQILDGHDESGEVHVNNNHVDFFPSMNFTYNFTEELLLRLAYGKTVNRPEFREISPFSFYNFEEKATIYGNPKLKNAYINNYDLRLEWYPSQGEMITLGGFYKEFKNPIEAHLKEYGTGWNYRYDNAIKADVYGVELDVRKTLADFGDQDNLLRYFKDLTLILNGSLMKSNINNDDPTERDKTRELQGQSPYLINAGIYYQNENNGLMVSVLYNRIGERIAYVGDTSNPHIYEEPFNSLDLTVKFQPKKFITISAGVKNLLNDDIIFKQYEEFNLDLNGDKVGDGIVKRSEIDRKYKPGRTLSLGMTFNF
ncbi:MAG: TonB-dependent receptor [Prolixibacteraceae bacterium]|jgi:TonB-dependent receptor